MSVHLCLSGSQADIGRKCCSLEPVSHFLTVQSWSFTPPPTHTAPPKPQTSHWKTEYPINLRGLLEINVSQKNSSNKNGYQVCGRFFVIGPLFLSFRWCFCPFYCILLNFQDAIFKLDIKAHLVKVPDGRRELQWNPINLFSKYYILYREILNQSVSISIVMIAPKYSH